MQQQVLPEQLQVGVPAQLLSNRPDVRQAEHNLAQYFYRVQHARSLFYPSLTISATAAFSGRFVPSLVGSLLQPIFARGAIKSNLRIAKAQYEQALVQFEQKLLEAGTEVNNALLQCSTARDKRSIRAEQIAALEQAMEHTQLLMRHGTTTYLEVIYAQQSLLKAQTEQLEDWLDEAQGVVALYRALGGGTK
ncbi:MAG: TolC family protein [Paludibacteraceae bacterium]